jgi:hypothetical protein
VPSAMLVIFLDYDRFLQKQLPNVCQGVKNQWFTPFQLLLSSVCCSKSGSFNFFYWKVCNKYEIIFNNQNSGKLLSDSIGYSDNQSDMQYFQSLTYNTLKFR